MSKKHNGRKNESRQGSDSKQAGSGKLDLWQRRLSESNMAYGDEVAKMDHREKLYNGSHELRPLVPGDVKKNGRKETTGHVRNIIFENIESQISSSIPQPKVTPRRKKDEKLADLIEHFLRNELDRLPFETMNDMAERTVPIQGGVGFLVEWDNTKRTHTTVGAVDISVVHPKQFAPQPGVYTGIQDMDWFILKIPTTKETIRRKYGVNVFDEGESEPDVRSIGGEEHSDAALTQYIGYEINDRGGIDRYSWVNDTELEDLRNYQARRQPVCAKCGRVKPLPGQVIYNDVMGGEMFPGTAAGAEDPLTEAVAGHLMAQQLAGAAMAQPENAAAALAGISVEPGVDPRRKYDGGAPRGESENYRIAGGDRAYTNGPCPWCGCEDFTAQEQEYEQVMLPIRTATGVQIPGATMGFDERNNPVMKPTQIPFYKPDAYPIILQRSVSVYGQLLGNSDVDAIEDQQNTVNRIEKKIIDRLLKAGTRITLPDKAELKVDPADGERWYLGSAAEKAMIDVYDFKGDLQFELAYLAQVYEEARQILGITDSFQGRRDPTATSGKAKEYAAAMAAGRLESKRIMKNAAYAAIFETMFKFWLAYSDEPRPISYKNSEGETQYEEFNRYDFLEQDEDGQWYWNDQFLFSCDTSAPLASNREAMWQETRMNLQTGAFGDPTQTETLILFWTKMEDLHYPGAASTKTFLEERAKREQAQMLQMQQLQMALQGNQGGDPAAGAAQQPAAASQPAIPGRQ